MAVSSINFKGGGFYYVKLYTPFFSLHYKKTPGE